jgi:ATP-dependent Zn protease
MVYFDQSKEDYLPYKTYSEKTAEKIDEKIKYYINDCYKKSKNIIIKNKILINKMSKVLLEKEFLTKEEFLESMNKKETKIKK